jgi:hypothetical protein
MKTPTKLLALAGIAGALTLAGCGPAYDRSYGGYGYSGYGGNTGSYDNSYGATYRSGYTYAPSYGYESRGYYYERPRSYTYDDYGRRYYYRRY